MNPGAGKYLIVIGVIIVIAGLIIYFFYDKLHWIGRLPGDIRMEKGNFNFYFPITTMVLLSLLVSLIAQVLKRLL
jgi:predicted phosphohydrolase